MRRDDAAPARGRTVVVWGSLVCVGLALTAAFVAGTWLASQAGAADSASDSSDSEDVRVASAAPVEPMVGANAALRIDDPASRAADNAASADAAANPTEPVTATGQADDRPTFDGRRLEKVRTINMRVTAYSPDERSCGEHADGITASGYSVWTNGMRLVAADTSVLPFKTLVSVPGYNGGRPVQVLDRGGAIKGNRLDVLYSTHERALHWGVQDVEVIVWRYADE